MYCFVLAAAEHNKYCVQFDDGTTKEYFSNTLHIEIMSASLPPPKRQGLISWQHEQQETEGGGEGQTDSEVAEDKNIQAALDGDEDEDLPGPFEEESPDDKEVQDETQEEDEEEAQVETQDDEEQQPVGTVGDHAVQEEANMYHGQKVAAVQCI